MLPLVGSTIVPPGRSFPSRSAASIIRSPMRSFTLPPGFMYSSLASSVGPSSRPTRWSRTSGVAPDEVEHGRILAGHAKRKPSSAGSGGAR